MTAPEEVGDPTPSGDPLRRITPPVDDVEARRARSSVAQRLFSGPSTPVTVGRYRIEGRIGSGAMGVVYRAHDPELARDVAVKVMNADSISTDQASTAQGRLLREARAMARLAHPNVLHVYDVGTVSDGVFIAMELVEGRSLATWLGQQRHPWREILARFVDAGRGLAAAHMADVVHRDFKPENVLVGDDGRVRVGDFGLAGPQPEDHPTQADTPNPSFDQLSGDLALTRTGSVLGTPKYMAPEQETDPAGGAKSDQFSFCVALFEALYGYAPFAGNTLSAYRKNVARGLVLPPTAETKVRSWVHSAIVTGLAVNPEDRHRTMGALIEVLEGALAPPKRAPRQARRRRVGFALTAVATVLALSAAWILGGRQADKRQANSDAGTTVATSTPDPETSPADASANAPPRQVDDATVAAVSPALGEATSAVAAGPEDPASEVDKTRKTPKASPEPALPRKPARRSYCLFTEDDYLFLARRSRRTEKFVDGSGQCYEECRKAPRHLAPTMTPPIGVSCTQRWVCAPAPTEHCNGS